MKLLSVEQIRALDQYTINHEPIASIDLMERAATACVKRIGKLMLPNAEVLVFCGMGNNGGDGLSITRQLLSEGKSAKAFVIRSGNRFSEDAEINYNRLKEKYSLHCLDVQQSSELPKIVFPENCVIVDALLGTGINKPVEGFLAEVIDFLNNSGQPIISIDMPSGLYADASSVNNHAIVQSTLCLTFQFPKLSFLLPQNEKFVPEFELLDIGLDMKEAGNAKSSNFYVTLPDIKSLIKPRPKFSHKGNFGHALLLAGSKGKSGAAIIASKACLRSGAGLLTLQSNKETTTALNHFLPEAMTREDAHNGYISDIEDPEAFDAIGFGPGVGMHDDTQRVLKKILQYYLGNLVIDADGLNILSENKTWLTFLPPDTILTPHVKEFERLTEKTYDDFDRLQNLKQFSLKYNCIVVLKGAHSCIAMPDGNLFFNSSGNASLAKGGSGDGLTGIILGLLARGYNAPQAALIGTYVHGLAAEKSSRNRSMESILISDVIDFLPKAFKLLEK